MDLVADFNQVEAFGGGGGRSGGARASGEDLFQIGKLEAVVPHLHECADEVADHPVKETVPVEGNFQNGSRFSRDSDGADAPDGGFPFVSGIGSEGGKIMLPHKKSGGLTDGFEAEGAGYVPSPADFHGMEKRLVDDPVKVGFALGRKAGVKLCGRLRHRKDAHPGGKVEVEGAEQSFRRMSVGHLAGGHLAEGVDAAVGTSGSGDVEGFTENFFESGLQDQLNGGKGILALPAKKSAALVGQSKLDGLLLQNGEYS